MLTWTGEVGPATVISGFIFIGGIIAWVKGLGIRDADLKYMVERFAKLEERVTKAENNFMAATAIKKRFDRVESAIETLDKAQEAFQGAVNAGSSLTREQIVRDYATKAELAALEERQNRGNDRILNALERLSGRLDGLNETVMKAMEARRV